MIILIHDIEVVAGTFTTSTSHLKGGTLFKVFSPIYFFSEVKTCDYAEHQAFLAY